MHIGVVAVLDGTSSVDGGALVDADGRFDIEAARRAVGRRLYRVPRFRQVLHVPPRLLGPPLWVDAPAVDLARHVHVLPLVPPAGTAQLVQAVEELWSPAARPRASPVGDVVPARAHGRPGRGAPEGAPRRRRRRRGDGAARRIARPGGDRGTPSFRSTARSAAVDSALLRDQLRRLRPSGRAVAALAHPVDLVRRTNRAWYAMRELDAVRRVPPTSLDRVVGPGRRLRVVSGRLDLVHDVAHAHGATVNDVLLAAVAGGLRALLLSRGEDVQDLHPLAYEPVTLLFRRVAAGRPDERRNDLRAAAARGRRRRRAAPPGGGGRRRLQAARHPRPGGRA